MPSDLFVHSRETTANEVTIMFCFFAFTCVKMEHTTQVSKQHNFDSFRLPPQLSSFTPCHSGTRLVQG